MGKAGGHEEWRRVGGRKEMGECDLFVPREKHGGQTQSDQAKNDLR